MFVEANAFGGDALGAVAPGNVAEALRMADAAMDYLNSSAADLDGTACGEALTALSGIQAKFAAAHAALLRRFDASNAHDADGCASSSAWLAANAGLSGKDAKAAVRQMRQLGERPRLADALTSGAITQSWAAAIAGWTRKLPTVMRDETDKIILDAAASGASLSDLATIAGLAIEKWRSQRPDQDNRSQEQRFHDSLQEACQLLIRARMVPDRAGADTQTVVHIPLSQLRDMPGAPELEDAWIRAKLGEPGYLSVGDAEVAACDALTVPVVTGHADMTVIDKVIALARAAGPAGLSASAWQAHRFAIARLAVDFVAGPGGLASALRTGLLEQPYNAPSLPLDIGFANSIPAHIRRAVILRDKHCAWPGGCDRPASASDVHHIVHKRDGGETSVQNCGLFCEYHHEICIHRWGWEIILHPDGTTEARSPDGSRVLRSHAPPAPPAAGQ
jgi:hypothetical protein